MPAPSSPAADPVALRLLRDVELYDPAPRGRTDVLLAGGRVAAVGRGLAARPAGWPVMEESLGGARVVPGFVDPHQHITGGGGEAGPHSRVAPLACADLVAAGITTVVGTLGTDDAIRTPAELVVTAYGLAARGIAAYVWIGGYHLPPRTLTGSVRRDLALVPPTVGVGEVAISDHRSSQPDVAALLAVAAEAHVGGLMGGKAGLLHLHVGDGDAGLAPVRDALARTELPARVFYPTHVNRRAALLDEAFALAARGCTIDLTSFPVRAGDDALAAEEALRRYLDAGLPAERVTLSSDAGGALPVHDAEGRVTSVETARPAAHAQALARLLARGEPLERVLPAFGANAARHLRLDAKGHLRPGADADLVVLDDDGGVRHVMAAGRWLLRDGAPVPEEAPA